MAGAFYSPSTQQGRMSPAPTTKMMWRKHGNRHGNPRASVAALIRASNHVDQCGFDAKLRIRSSASLHLGQAPTTSPINLDRCVQTESAGGTHHQLNSKLFDDLDLRYLLCGKATNGYFFAGESHVTPLWIRDLYHGIAICHRH